MQSQPSGLELPMLSLISLVMHLLMTPLRYGKVGLTQPMRFVSCRSLVPA